MKKFLGMIALVAVVMFSFAGSSFAWDSYWSKEKWPEGKANGVVPPCGVNVLPLGGDDILQATVDTYCGLNPGKYRSFINPAVKKIYDSNGTKYPDGITAILELKDIKAAFVTSHKGGKPVYDAISLETGKSIASKDKGHPLNPETCANCHASYNKACIKRGYTCGNR
ncbi:MAG: hypothetical protein OEV28_03260 [Nitrospirota bacterium]|nr:hypothetical protein [Nitrospirota bacterium]